MATTSVFYPFSGYDASMALIPRLEDDGSNWSLFSVRFREAMQATRRWGYYDSTTARPVPVVVSKPTDDEKKAIAAWDHEDAIAGAYLIACLPDHTALEVSDLGTVEE
jgi:hypothetical protein